MYNLELWKLLDEIKEKYVWVDLTHDLSSKTPHWNGWEDLRETVKADLDSSLFDAHEYTTVGQYGTHVDAPCHMVKGGRTLDQIDVDEMVYPLCVIDKSDEVAKNVDYSLTKQDVLDFEKKYGRIPKGAMVFFKSDWSKREPSTMDNLDENGQRHFPGWSLDAVKFLVEEREIGSIGHETSDTEAPILSEKSDYEVEYYILAQDKIQIELVKGLDKLPAVGGLVFCTFPKVSGGSGFPARCFALIPQN